MLGSLSPVDYGVLALYLLAIVGLGIYFAAEQKTSRDFFLAGRSLNWFPLGMSLSVALVSALTFVQLPGQAYEHGLKTLLVPLSVWLVLPVLVVVVLPIYRGLKLFTLYEYLELRFDARVRLLGCLAFVVWRLLWLAWIIYAPCQAVVIASGLENLHWPLLLTIGLVATFYTCLGGIKGVVWADVMAGLAMLGGAAIVIGGMFSGLSGGADGVTQVASGLSRLPVADFTFDWQSAWSLWGALPHWMLAHLSFYAADQITAQRFLAARIVDAARTSYLASCVVSSALHAVLIYVGLCLLAFYHQRPQEMRPEWVANVDNISRLPMRGQDGGPLIDPADPLSPTNVDELVRQQKLLKPNSKEPFTDAEELIDPESGQLVIEKLAMRRPTQGQVRGEIIVAKGAAEKMLPEFIAEHLPWGAAGVLLAALLAATVSSLNSGISAIGSVLVMDLHRRYGVGKAWLARRLGKTPDDLTEADELRLGRALTLVVGIAATLLALLVAQVRDIFDMMAVVASTFGAPLLGVFLLGMFTRRCTAAGALVALIGGGLCTVGIAAYNKLAALGMVTDKYAQHDIWLVTFGTLSTLIIGYAASLIIGRRKTNRELRGLVFGCGSPGVMASEEEVTVIGDIEATDDADESGVRWR